MFLNLCLFEVSSNHLFQAIIVMKCLISTKNTNLMLNKVLFIEPNQNKQCTLYYNLMAHIQYLRTLSKNICKRYLY